MVGGVLGDAGDRFSPASKPWEVYQSFAEHPPLVFDSTLIR